VQKKPRKLVTLEYNVLKSIFNGLEDKEAYLNDMEQMYIQDMISYSASSIGVDKSFVEKLVKKYFEIGAIDKLPRNNFEKAIRFTIDLTSTNNTN
jgi:hypothetical protein